MRGQGKKLYIVAYARFATAAQVNSELDKNKGRLGRDARVVEEIERKIRSCGGKVFYADFGQNVLRETTKYQMRHAVTPSGSKPLKPSDHSEH